MYNLVKIIQLVCRKLKKCVVAEYNVGITGVTGVTAIIERLWSWYRELPLHTYIRTFTSGSSFQPCIQTFNSVGVVFLLFMMLVVF